MRFFFLAILFRCTLCSAQVITTVAGIPVGGSHSDDVPATSAYLGFPGYIAFDDSGNYYFGTDLYTVRKISYAGVITTIAGTSGAIGYSGDGGAATDAKMSLPGQIAVDKYNNIFITDMTNNRIRKVDLATGLISTVAGNGTAGYSSDGTLATAAMISNPCAIAFDGNNNLYFMDGANNLIRKIDSIGVLSTVAGNGTFGDTGDGNAATVAELASVGSLRFDIFGGLYICETERIRRVSLATGIIKLMAGTDSVGYSGDGGPATAADLHAAADVLPDMFGGFYISDDYNYVIRKVDSTGFISTIAGTGVAGYGGDGGAATLAKLNITEGIALDACGSLYISDPQNGRIRKVTYPPVISVPTIALTGSSTGVVGTTVTVDATVGSSGSSYVIYWMDDGVVFTTTTVPYVTYTKAAGTDTITARIVPTGYGCWDSTTSAAHTVGMTSEGAQSLSKGEGVMVYPNPAHGKVQVISNVNISELTVANILGQMVREKKCASAHEQMDVSGLPPGLYLLRITDEYGTVNMVKLMVDD